jgi:hypothetical protein
MSKRVIVGTSVGPPSGVRPRSDVVQPWSETSRTREVRVELGPRYFIVNHPYYRSGTGQHAEVQEAKDTDCLALTT